MSVLCAQPGDVMTYVDPLTRMVRHHRVALVEWRKLDRVVFRGDRFTAEPATHRVCLLPELHQHETYHPPWVAHEDVLVVRRASR